MPSGEALRRSPSAASVEVDGETVLWLAGALHRLDPSATSVWRALADPATKAELVQTLATAYEVSPTVLGADVEALLEKLLDLGLLEPVEAGKQEDTTASDATAVGR
jgi:hypothetical protein